MKKKLKMYIQGEVILKQIEKLPSNLPEKNHKGIAAYGETGNAHQFVEGNYNLYGTIPSTQKWLEVVEPTKLVHGLGGAQGHETLQIEPGVYEIYPQNEIDIIDRKVRTVLD